MGSLLRVRLFITLLAPLVLIAASPSITDAYCVLHQCSTGCWRMRRVNVSHASTLSLSRAAIPYGTPYRASKNAGSRPATERVLQIREGEK